MLILHWLLTGKKTKDNWFNQGQSIPPVMITVCNITNTSARIEKAIKENKLILSDDLNNKNTSLRIDSQVLKKAEEKDEIEVGLFAGKKPDEYREHLRNIVKANTGLNNDLEKGEELLNLKKEELLRKIIDTVGDRGQAGEQIRHVIAVDMLSEGWDAKNVTHIMGLRAFSSQLLCEQVIGRGLRRMSYEVDDKGFFDPEYVNVFGVPFTLLPFAEDDNNSGSVTTPPRNLIEVSPKRSQYEILWPNVKRIESKSEIDFKTTVDQIDPLSINADMRITKVDLRATIITRLANYMPMSNTPSYEINLDTVDLPRLQAIIFSAVNQVIIESADKYRKFKPEFFSKVVLLVGQFIQSDKLQIISDGEPIDNKKRILTKIKKMNKIAKHVLNSIQIEEKESTELVFNPEKIRLSTADMQAWWTSKQTYQTVKSHINPIVYDSDWEKIVGQKLDDQQDIGQYVQAWVKNNRRINFAIKYLWKGLEYDYLPDFLIRLNNDSILILEIKGQPSAKTECKKAALDRWVKAVNNDGRFGHWISDIIFDPKKIDSVILKYGRLKS